MSDREYQRAKIGVGHSVGEDAMRGVDERECARAARNPPKTLEITAPDNPIERYKPWQPKRSSGDAHSRPAIPETLGSMARGGAGLGAALFIGYLLLNSSAWSWPQVVAMGAGGAVAGLVGGALLFVALEVCKIALKVLSFLFVVGIALHLLGVINFLAVLSKAGRVIGF